MNRFYVLTGGPGSGKSSLVAALHERGHHRMLEAGRAIIQDQQLVGGNAVPWDSPRLFAELMLCWDIRSYHLAESLSGPVFFDRGVTDTLAYLHLLGMDVPQHMQNAARIFRYDRRVFIAPPWQEIFHQDCERKQDFPEAIRTYDALVATYTAFDYELVEIPRVSVEERANFVLNKIE